MPDLSAFSNSVSIIVPTLNEEENIIPLVSQIAESAVPFREILFVDDHSTDGTRDKIRALARNQSIRLIEQNGAAVGLAGAIMSGARAAQGEILLVMDADLSHPPERIARPRNPDHFPRTHTGTIENVAWHRATIFFPLGARYVPPSCLWPVSS